MGSGHRGIRLLAVGGRIDGIDGIEGIERIDRIEGSRWLVGEGYWLLVISCQQLKILLKSETINL